MNKGYEWAQSIVWNEQTISTFKKDLEKLNKIQRDIFFTQSVHKVLGYDAANKLLHDMRAFNRVMSAISFNNAKEKNIDILVNASEYWRSAEASLMKVKKICAKGEKTSFKNKLNKHVDNILNIKRYLGDANKLFQVKKQWLLHGLITIPVALVIITLVFLLTIEVI